MLETLNSPIEVPDDQSRSEGPHVDWIFRLLGQQPAEFIEGVQGRTMLKHHLDGAVLRLLPSWSDLNSFLETQRLAFPRARFEGAGMSQSELDVYVKRILPRGYETTRVDVPKVYDRLATGATLVIDFIDEAIPALRQVSEGLGAHLPGLIQINAYISYGASPSFGNHWDDHDIIVIQLEGRKRWSLSGTSRQSPVYGDPAPHPPPQGEREEVVLERGDVLYLPRGHWHEVEGLAEPSLHLTIGIWVPTGLDYLGWLMVRAKEEEALRRDLAIMPGGQAASQAEVEGAYTRLSKRHPIGAYLQQLKERRAPSPRFSLPLGVGVSPGDDDRVEATFSSSGLEQDGEELILRAAGRETRFGLAMRPFVEALRAGERLSVAEAYRRCAAAGLSQTDWFAFLNSLIAGHLISVERGGA